MISFASTPRRFGSANRSGAAVSWSGVAVAVAAALLSSSPAAAAGPTPADFAALKAAMENTAAEVARVYDALIERPAGGRTSSRAAP